MSSGSVRKIIKSESQPVLVPATQGGNLQIYFPDNQYIRNKKLTNLILNVDQDAAPAGGQQYVDGKRIMTMTECNAWYLTLESYSGVQFIRKKPINLFNPYNIGANNINFFMQFVGQKVNWPKCFIESAPNFVASPLDRYILWDVEFTELTEATLKEQLSPTFGQRK